MSGLFIKDMSLPEHCGKCPLALLNGWGERYCFVTDHDVTACDGWTYNRHSECPMEEREE